MSLNREASVTILGKILIVDDDEGSRTSLGEAMTLEGYAVTLASSGEEAVELGQGQDFDVVIVDLRMKGIDGLQVVRTFKNSRPETVLIIMTGFASMETVVDAISAGAYDYISKPFRLDQMRLKVRQSMSQAKLMRENRYLRERVQDRYLQNLIIGSSPKMVEVFKAMAKVASSEANVLIQGESGTGKELVARSIHRLGLRKEKPFQAVNCTSVTESLLESELFGYVKGAFTGAGASKRGIFEAADRGTVFLDEIGDTSPAMQSKLLRVLESGEIMPVGSSTSIHVNVRVIAASNRDLTELVAKGKFREDLYYRLKVVTIELPPLRERLSDLPLLFDFFLKKYSARNNKTLAVNPGVLGFLQSYSWPGNVRQLENVVERAIALNISGVFDLEDLPEEIQLARKTAPREQQGPWPTLDEMENRYIKEVLDATGGNMSRAAEILGIDRRTLYRKLDKSED
jgi:two-component system, NtrC family, response regulator AtoC